MKKLSENLQWILLLLAIFIFLSSVGLYLLYRLDYFENFISSIKTKGVVKVDSQVPGYDLKVANKSQLYNLLDEIGFWQEMAISDIRTPKVKMSSNTLYITLIPRLEERWWREVTEDNILVTSLNTEVLKNGEVKIDFTITGEFLERDVEFRNSLANRIFIRGLYGLCSTCREARGVSKDNSENMQDFIILYYQKYPNLLAVNPG